MTNVLTMSRPLVSPMVEEALQEIAAGGRYTPTVGDIVWLHDLADRVRRGGRRTVHEDLPIPVVCGAVSLHRMTLGAAMWLAETGNAWLFEQPPRWWNADEWFTVAMAWVLVNARDPDRLFAVQTQVAARAEVIQFARTFRRSLAALGDAVTLALGLQDSTIVEVPRPDYMLDQKREADGYGDVLAFLHGTFHQPARYFLWEITDGMLASYIDEALRLSASGDKDAVSAQVRGGERALAEFRAVVQWMKAGAVPVAAASAPARAETETPRGQP